MAFHLIFPAAGVGRRFGLDIPKQYCVIQNRTVMEWTLSVFQSVPDIFHQIIALSAEDKWANEILPAFSRLVRVDGGKERADSVSHALSFLSEIVDEDDWVMVHDIARPCIQVSDLIKLMRHCQETGHGAVLGHPVTDTIKSYRRGEAVKTVDRSTLWAVQTPQCFRLGELQQALQYCANNKILVTDEASAIEAFNGVVDVVEGDRSNIKLTHASDQALVTFYLQQQGRL
ncbi:MAG: 2-C-methyl-D-erythritol 4-phosphate cytidylyltransferase [Reinekea sp.]|jgi:2-C-methyl-D-erythritol 4-phosphate cytidylyltransferase